MSRLCEVCVVVTQCLILISDCTTASDHDDCRRALDVVFLVDASSDVTDTDWNSSVELVTEIFSQLSPSTFGTHVGVLVFAANTTTVRRLSHQPLTFNQQSRSDRRGRELALALRNARSLVFTNQDGDRPEVPDVLITITHRVSDDTQSAIMAAEQLKSDGIRIIAVGIGSQGVVDELTKELQAIETFPDKLISVQPDYVSEVLPERLLQAICRREFDVDEGSVRLADESAASGRLEMFIRAEWITVCADTWSSLNTDVACRQLGYPAGVSWYTVQDNSTRRRTGLGNVTCLSNESRLIDCPHSPVFDVGPHCHQHQRDVFLRCLCAQCTHYGGSERLRLVDGGSVYGRLEVFTATHSDRWGGICRNGWTFTNTRVACHQLGFRDGAGTYNSDDDAPGTQLVLDRVNCTGNESSLFDCPYHVISADNNCSHPVNVRCQCNTCVELDLLQSPHERQTATGSSVQFVWKLNNSRGKDFEFWFLSRKNHRLVLRQAGDLLTIENSDLQRRVKLVRNSETTLGFSLANVTRTDMGTYALHVPRLRLFDSQAILFVTDFAVVPDRVIHCQVNDNVTLSWDLTALRQMRDVSHEILLTTPATGRLHLDYYNAHWLSDNAPRHRAVQPTDDLHVIIIIDDVTEDDAGLYVVEVMLTSSVHHRWLNVSWQFMTSLVVDTTDQQSITVIVLASLLALASLAVFILLVLAVCRRRTRTTDDSERPVQMTTRGHSKKSSRRYNGKGKEPGASYNGSEMYNEDQQSNDGTLDINIRADSPQPPAQSYYNKTRSEYAQSRRMRFAATSIK